MCSVYPILVKNETVVFYSDCPAVKNQLFEKYYLEIKELNYVILIV